MQLAALLLAGAELDVLAVVQHGVGGEFGALAGEAGEQEGCLGVDPGQQVVERLAQHRLAGPVRRLDQVDDARRRVQREVERGEVAVVVKSQPAQPHGLAPRQLSQQEGAGPLDQRRGNRPGGDGAGWMLRVQGFAKALDHLRHGGLQIGGHRDRALHLGQQRSHRAALLAQRGNVQRRPGLDPDIFQPKLVPSRYLGGGGPEPLPRGLGVGGLGGMGGAGAG